MKRINFAIIGPGKIAKEHGRVIKALGHDISLVLSRTNNDKVNEFCKLFNVKNIVYNIKDFLAKKNQFDALVICTPWHITEEIIINFISIQKPILVEKPMVLTLEKFKTLKNTYSLKNILIGFNRRYYDFIPKLQNIIKDKELMHIEILSSEPYSNMDRSHNLKEHMLFFYSIHIIDLIFYLIPDLSIVDMTKKTISELNNYFVKLYSKKFDVNINLNILLDIPQNSYVRFFFKERVIELLPLEEMVSYTKMEKTFENNVSKYSPKKDDKYRTSHDFKPGFFRQMEFFLKNYVYSRNNDSHIKEYERIMTFCEKLKNI